MTDAEMELVRLLYAYEMDEPHVNLPDLDVGPEEKQFYAKCSAEHVYLTLSADHLGDCTGQPAPCERCWIEQLQHKAKWLVARMRRGRE